MSQNGQGSPSRFVWHDLMSVNVEASEAFFTQLFGWRVEKQDMGEGIGTYNVLFNGEAAFGGIMPFEGEHGLPSHWVPYTSVKDIAATLESVQASGGEVCFPAVHIPNVGRFSMINSPDGAFLSPIQFDNQEAEMPEFQGAGYFCWNELLTNDPEGSATFYTGLFGWATAPVDTPQGTYWLFKREAGGKDVGGMMQMPSGAEGKPAWLSYVAVENADATADQIETLGGKLFVKPTDIPNIGRFAVAQDPTGAMFAILQGVPA